jgi:glutamate formiminotransferase
LAILVRFGIDHQARAAILERPVERPRHDHRLERRQPAHRARSLKTAAVREGGRNGGLPGVRALGLACASTGRVQVSMNIEDYRRTPLGDVVARVRSEAARRGRIIGLSELVGLVPRDALTGTTPALLGLPRFDPAQIIPED